MLLARQTGWGHEALMGMDGAELMAWFTELRDQIKRENETAARPR